MMIWFTFRLSFRNFFLIYIKDGASFNKLWLTSRSVRFCSPRKARESIFVILLKLKFSLCKKNIQTDTTMPVSLCVSHKPFRSVNRSSRRLGSVDILYACHMGFTSVSTGRITPCIRILICKQSVPMAAGIYIKAVFSGIRNPMLKIRRSWDRLIYNMGFPILVRRLCIETTPRRVPYFQCLCT